MHAATRFAVPAALAAGLAATAVLVPRLASADPELPPTTAAELLADVASAQAQPFSGTAVSTSDLGLPELPDQRHADAGLAALLAGSTTAQLWYAGPERARVAVLGELTETDLVRSGDDVWVWRHAENEVAHATVPEHEHEKATGDALDGHTSPVDAAQAALAAVEPSTEVTLDGTASVAGRDAHELVLAPRDAESLVGEVRIAVDAVTSLPLRVQVLPRGASSPAYENGFTDITYAEPDPSVFAFTPPAGAEVTELTRPEGDPSARAEAAMPHAATAMRPTTVGEAWTTVAVLRGVDADALAAAAGDDGVGATLMAAFQPVSGDYGSGRLFTSSLVSVLLLDDGRALAGAVVPAVLERAALDPAAAVIPPAAGGTTAP